MLQYLLKRLGLVIPTLLGIFTLNFFVIQMTPGGPVEQFIASLEGTGSVWMERVGTAQGDPGAMSAAAEPASQGLLRGTPPEIVAAVERLYGFDRPVGERYLDMLGDYLTFDFGESFFKADPVISLIREALPVSMTLGIWSTLLIYMVSVPLGIARAVRRNSAFDVWTGTAVVVASAIPGFLFAVLLIVLFAGGSYLQIFPLRGLHSPGFEEMSFAGQTLDYLHHICLPVISLSIGGFAGLTLLTRNSFLDELGKQYVELARAKGVSERTVLLGHVFRNAMLIVISGLPGTFVRMFFAGSLLIETIFSLNGLGLLGFEATMQRDYPVMFATLWIFTLIGLVANIAGDIVMHFVDPRIDFTARGRA
ncbi:microcin C ABC transporter permease YejB [Sutterella sp.]|uniref:microcin C ABC transporter permease YejB n=1 Tax=Sutterella sp. TaxID=1981025 RepID=UPI0026E0D4EB|nr:microcin C ABC transporter permease YejB [Sutterella sp.]MDO5531791.1 microcin C ABC transporter permease YejB [Sutterella sp.]